MTKQLQLSSEDVEVLGEALQIYLSELSGEIGNTDKHDFREDLKHKREVLRSIHERVLHA